MSLHLYDESMESKLKSVFPNVVGASTEEAFSASQVDGKVKLPLISFYRMGNPIDSSQYNTAGVFHGRPLQVATTPMEAMTIPVLITYQVDIWGTSRRTVDDIFRELTFYLIRKPNLTITVGHHDEPLDFSMSLTDTDNATEISDFSNIGRVYRTILTFEVHGQMFYEKAYKPVSEIPIESIPTDANPEGRSES